MTDRRRFIWFLTMAAFLISANGCSTSRWLQINEELDREGSGIHKESGQAISGYQLHDGPETDYVGWVRLADQDSLVFWRLDNANSSDILDYENSWTVEPTAIAGPMFSLATVKTLKIVEAGSGEAMLLVTLIAGFAFVEVFQNFEVMGE